MLTEPKTVEDFVMICLQKGPLPKAQLIEKVMKSRPKTALQSIYQEIRKLKTMEIVVIRKDIISLSSIWVHDMMNYFHAAQSFLADTTLPYENYRNLKEGERVSYTFQTAEQLDIFWGHIFILINQTAPANESTILFHPHEWFFVARHVSEEKLYNDLSNQKRPTYVITNNRESLDLEIVKKYKKGSLEWHSTNDNFLWKKDDYYCSSFGDILVEGWVDKKTSVEIHDYFKRYTSLAECDTQELHRIITRKGKNKLIISRNRKRVQKIRTWFAKYFLIK